MSIGTADFTEELKAVLVEFSERNGFEDPESYVSLEGGNSLAVSWENGSSGILKRVPFTCAVLADDGRKSRYSYHGRGSLIRKPRQGSLTARIDYSFEGTVNGNKVELRARNNVASKVIGFNGKMKDRGNEGIERLDGEKNYWFLVGAA